MSILPVEKGIPMPEMKSHSSRRKYPWYEMEVGDSFAFPEGTTMAKALTTASSQSKNGREFKSRRVDGGIRCWRIA